MHRVAAQGLALTTMMAAAGALVASCGSSGSGFGDERPPGALGDGGPPLFADADPGPGGLVTSCAEAEATRSTMGCEFYGLAPDAITLSRGGCYAVVLVNTANAPATIEVARGGAPLAAALGSYAMIPRGTGTALAYEPLAGPLAPGQVALLFLNKSGGLSTACPAGITPATTDAASVVGTGRGQAFRVRTSSPVVAYDIFPYGGGSSAVTSATLLLPTSTWDKNYVAVNAYRKSRVVAEDQPYIAVVAKEDGTTVTVNPVANIAGSSTVAGGAAGKPVSYGLGRGEVLQLGQDAELTGSAIEADKPIALWGGSTCASMDADQGSACDAAHQQIPPVRAMGAEYTAVRYRNRFDGKEESPPWRIVGAVDGTTLGYEPAQPPGAPSTIGFGQVVEFRSPGPFVVKSQDAQHPFYMSAHMTGWGEVSTATDHRGDPEFVNVLPAAQFLKSYVFFTDPTYPETNLVLVRARTDGAFKDVRLDCAGVVGGFQPLGSGGQYEYARVDLSRGNFEKQGACDNGRHEIASEGLFGLTVWGWGSAASGGNFGAPGFSQAVSYAYPAGGSLKAINNVVVPTGPR
ncbi:MAG: hypothetical protein HOO96_24675 [Polyangiaceae bacterium]|nr:hypothetical protein [Polyangiaceae bacterium]